MQMKLSGITSVDLDIIRHRLIRSSVRQILGKCVFNGTVHQLFIDSKKNL
jgi:hypothetical protein